MSDITLWQKNLPEVHIPADQLKKPLGRLEYIGLVSELTANLGSDAYSYSLQRMLMTIQQAEQLKQTYQGGMPPLVEDTYNRLTRDYLALIARIPQEVSARLLEELKQIPANIGEDSLWAKVHALLGDLLDELLDDREQRS